MQTVGVIGLGAMGLAMAQTLAAKGFAVIGYDVAPERRQKFPRTVSALDDMPVCEIVLLSLPNDAIVSEVASRILDRMPSGSVVIDSSTVLPATSRALGAEADKAGIGYVDAPVSGGASGAAGGTLLVMAGGSDAAIARARPVLDALARKVVVCGSIGSGNAVKLVNNMLCAGHLLLIGEALRVAASQGLAPDVLMDALNSGSGRSAVTEVNLPRWILSGTFDSAFSMGLMTKDVTLAQSLDGAGPIAEEIACRWQTASQDIGSSEDFNRIVEAKLS